MPDTSIDALRDNLTHFRGQLFDYLKKNYSADHFLLRPTQSYSAIMLRETVVAKEQVYLALIQGCQLLAEHISKLEALIKHQKQISTIYEIELEGIDTGASYSYASDKPFAELTTTHISNYLGKIKSAVDTALNQTETQLELLLTKMQELIKNPHPPTRATSVLALASSISIQCVERCSRFLPRSPSKTIVYYSEVASRYVTAEPLPFDATATFLNQNFQCLPDLAKLDSQLEQDFLTCQKLCKAVKGVPIIYYREPESISRFKKVSNYK